MSLAHTPGLSPQRRDVVDEALHNGLARIATYRVGLAPPGAATDAPQGSAPDVQFFGQHNELAQGSKLDH